MSIDLQTLKVQTDAIASPIDVPVVRCGSFAAGFVRT
jgi:hypothetical protein